MSYFEYEQLLKDRGIPRTDAVGGEITLKKSDAIRALELLENTDIAVLGGDVYELESDGYFRPTYDNWYYNMSVNNKNDYACKSRQIAIEYIQNYNETKSNDIWYVIVLNL